MGGWFCQQRSLGARPLEVRSKGLWFFFVFWGFLGLLARQIQAKQLAWLVAWVFGANPQIAANILLDPERGSTDHEAAEAGPCQRTNQLGFS